MCPMAVLISVSASAQIADGFTVIYIFISINVRRRALALCCFCISDSPHAEVLQITESKPAPHGGGPANRRTKMSVKPFCAISLVA